MYIGEGLRLSWTEAAGKIEEGAGSCIARLTEDEVRGVVFEVLSYSHMNEIASYGGFPIRYPHWRFGMSYEQLAKSSEYGLQTITRW